MKRFPTYEDVIAHFVENPYACDHEDTGDLILPPCVAHKYDSHGAWGGSCWDEGPDEGAMPYDNGPGDLDVARRVLDELRPGAPGDMLAALRECEQEDVYSSYEYYGNYSVYRVVYITHADIARILSDLRYDI